MINQLSAMRRKILQRRSRGEMYIFLVFDRHRRYEAGCIFVCYFDISLSAKFDDCADKECADKISRYRAPFFGATRYLSIQASAAFSRQLFVFLFHALSTDCKARYHQFISVRTSCNSAKRKKAYLARKSTRNYST